MTHLDADRLADLDEGLLSAADTGAAQSHLEACPESLHLLSVPQLDRQFQFLSVVRKGGI